MENNGNKMTPEELADEALDQVAGGGVLPEDGADFMMIASFRVNNCQRCKYHHSDFSQCPYGGIDGGFHAMVDGTCPGLVRE